MPRMHLVVNAHYQAVD